MGGIFWNVLISYHLKVLIEIINLKIGRIISADSSNHAAVLIQDVYGSYSIWKL